MDLEYVLYCTDYNDVFVSKKWTRGNIGLTELQYQFDKAMEECEHEQSFDFSKVKRFLVIEANRNIDLSCVMNLNRKIPKYAIEFDNIELVIKWINIVKNGPWTLGWHLGLENA